MELDLWRYLLALAVVFGLLGLLLYRFGRLPGAGGGARTGALLHSRDRLRLTPQHSVHLVHLGARCWLIACHPGGASLLGEASSLGETAARSNPA